VPRLSTDLEDRGVEHDFGDEERLDESPRGPRPFRQGSITGSTGGETTTFSKWGENVVEQHRSGTDTIAYATVMG